MVCNLCGSVKKECSIKIKIKKLLLAHCGFSLVEMLSVLAILGVAAGIFHTTWMTNWKSVEEHQARADLWYDSNQIIEQLTSDGRFAWRVNVEDFGKTVSLSNRSGTIYATYMITDIGEMRVIKPDEDDLILSTRVNVDLSVFERTGFSLRLSLFLEDSVLSGLVTVETSAEVYPRNRD